MRGSSADQASRLTESPLYLPWCSISAMVVILCPVGQDADAVVFGWSYLAGLAVVRLATGVHSLSGEPGSLVGMGALQRVGAARDPGSSG